MKHEIPWVVNTDNADDLGYLDEIIKSNPAVRRKLVIPGEKLWVYSYYKAWQRLDRGKYYVKIDDDIAPHKSHRWLRVKDDNMVSQTLAAELKYEVWGPRYESSAIAAQMHYSLLDNIEDNKTR
ncbi:retrovirus polyprotein [Purpureocillium lavendulum]|uniref:Retrovirus polyprotein n=1 Tax=Purpureocillium lavendulum TaxID=1247861 RepID=A0AB34FAJ0_9HYPO|nr:retrovirus polyprotein [Purpureocillium lavendulum]